MPENIKVAYITPSVSRSAGGIYEVELALAKSVSKQNCQIFVYSQFDENTENDIETWGEIPLYIYPSIGPNAFRFSPQLKKAVTNSLCDLAHLHVMWMYTSVVTNSWHRGNRPYVVTIHGMLEPWALKNAFWKKKLVHYLYEGRCLRNAACIHAHTYKEYLDIRKYGLKNPVCIIPNGIDLPDLINYARKPAWFESTNGRKVMLYLGRLHPKKGLENLIESWSAVTKAKPHWCLVIAGWGEQGYEKKLKEIAVRSGVEDKVIFAGPQFKEEKIATFSYSDAFILPSFSEGLPMAILEAWAYKKPAIYTEACNLPEGYAKKAGWKISNTPESLANEIMGFLNLSTDERSEIGRNGFDLASEKYSWDKVGQQMAAVYKWLAHKGHMPETVIVD